MEAYWLRIMYQEGDDWLKWLDCRQPTWVNWDPTLDNGSANRLPSTACAYASTANGHRWRSGICESSVPDVVVCEKEAGEKQVVFLQTILQINTVLFLEIKMLKLI